ncbi:MAG: FumA C-terminus/TtdB family hydratase beta subunit [Thermoplasmata archaeon]
MSKKRFTVPMSEEDVRSLDAGDIVYLDGVIYTGRDEVHIHALDYLKEGKEIPVDFKDSVIFHCGPIMKKEGDRWITVAAGPTTSSRMNSLEPDFIEKFGIRGVIGKGGMSAPTVEAMEKFGCVYYTITGGAAVLIAKGVEEVLDVYWLELGMPEAIWVLKVKNFGPLTVGIDAEGNSLFADIGERVNENIPKVKEQLGI